MDTSTKKMLPKALNIFVIREIQIKKITMKCLSGSISMTKTKAGKGLTRLGAIETPTHPWKEGKSGIATLENSLAVSYEVIQIFTTWPVNLLLGIHRSEVKNLCLQPLHKYLIATLFKIAPTLKQPKCLFLNDKAITM